MSEARHSIAVDPMYSVFEDERRYQPWGDFHPGNLTNDMLREFVKSYSPKKYDIKEGLTIWFDSVNRRVATEDDDLYLQFISSGDMGRVERRLFCAVGDRRVQFSKSTNKSLASNIEKTDGKQVWEISQIGAPLYFHTGTEDDRRGVKRPLAERRQCLTNSRSC